MTQFPKRAHPARDRLELAGRDWPGIWAEFEAERLRAEMPDGIYVTGDAGMRALTAWMRKHGPGPIKRLRDALTPDQMRQQIVSTVGYLTTLSCWRMTQGIYRVDPALYGALVDTQIDGDLPVSVLDRLPEWCVYVETPGLSDDGYVGAFARRDVSEQSGQQYLTLNLDGANGVLRPVALPLGGSLRDCIERARRALGTDEAAAAAIERAAAPVINLLLYLCSRTDVSGRHGQPGNPTPTRTRRDGWRLFPVDGPRLWDVGVRMGAALRAAYQAEETAGHGAHHAGPRGHIRHAHWHGFRSGPKKRPDGSDIPTDSRRFDLRWLPPIPVNLPDVDSLPATIHPVRGDAPT